MNVSTNSINYGQRCYSLFPAGMLVVVALLIATGQPLHAQDTAQGSAEKVEQVEVDGKTQARYDAFSEAMSGSKLVGNFTVVGQDNSDLTKEEYHIKSVEKMPRGDMWLFTARIKYGERDISVPIPLEVKWAGDDTPVITLTDFSFFGVGPFSSRVVFYNGKYAGTWSHGDVGGHMFGEVEPGKAEGVDVEKSKREMEAKMKEDKSEEKGSDSKQDAGKADGKSKEGSDGR